MRIDPVRRMAAFAVLGAVLAAAGCGRGARETAAPASPDASANGERRFALTGVVVSSDPARKVLVVRHD